MTLSPAFRRPSPRALVAALACAAMTSCHGNDNAQRPDATVAPVRSESSLAPANSAPDNAALVVRGGSLRRAVPLLVPQGSAEEVMQQVARQMTPGVANHGGEIDVDAPFALIALVTESTEHPVAYAAAWPLRAGMQLSQDARAHRGWRSVADGLYAPTATDAGANADEQCWLAQRPPVGWMMLCASRTTLPTLANFLRERATTAPDENAVLDADLRVPAVRSYLSRQLANLEQAAPPASDAGVAAVRHALYEQAHRTLALFSSLANDVDAVHATVRQDENAMHVRATADMPRASSDRTRALLASSAGRQGPADLLARMPATVNAWVINGFDHVQAAALLGGGEPDPMLTAQAGPELARVVGMVEDLKTVTSIGERADGYSTEDGYTIYHVIHTPNASQYVNDLRVAMNSVPARVMAAMGAVRLSMLPTPGLTGLNFLRVGQVAALPPAAQLQAQLAALPAQQRQMVEAQLAQVHAVTERSMLVAADGDRLVVVMARDPIARYQALASTPHLAVTPHAGSVFAGHITPVSLTALFYGGAIPGLPESHTTDGMDYALTVERRGEGGHVELTADAPIAAAVELRTIYAMVQEAQAEQMQAQMQAQQRAAQQQQQGGAPGGAGAGGGMMMRPPAQRARPAVDPSQLPPPPQLQLQAPSP